MSQTPSPTSHVLRSHNPATGELLGTVAVTSQEDIVLAVAAARQSFQSWSRLSLDERLRFIERFHCMQPSMRSHTNGTNVSQSSGSAFMD